MKENFFKGLVTGLSLGLGFLLILFFFSKIGFSLPLNIQSVITDKSDLFTVTGEGKIIVIPDIAYVNLGVEATGETVSQVQEKINQVNNQLIEVLKRLKITKKDIQTEAYNLHPQYDWQNNNQKIIGYRGETTLKIKIKPLEKINQVIDEATKIGITNIYGVNFDVENKEKYLSLARQQAVKEAKNKAREAAKITGFRLGKIVNYSETTSSPINQPIYLRGGMKSSTEEQTDIQPGSQEIKITVSLGYEID